jgi:hypothetical protein
MVRSLPVSVWARASAQRPADWDSSRGSHMVELIQGHSDDVLTRLVEVMRCASR